LAKTNHTQAWTFIFVCLKVNINDNESDVAKFLDPK